MIFVLINEKPKKEGRESQYGRIQGGRRSRHEICKKRGGGRQPLCQRTVHRSGTVLFGYLDGQLEHGSIEQFYKNVDRVGADAGFRARVDVVAVEETLAVVRVLEENWGGRIDFTDYLLLLKMDGQWRCVAKAYNQNSDTIQKQK